MVLPFIALGVVLKALAVGAQAIIQASTLAATNTGSVAQAALNQTVGPNTGNTITSAADKVYQASQSPAAQVAKKAYHAGEKQKLTDEEKHDQALAKLEQSLRDLELTTFGEEIEPMGKDSVDDQGQALPAQQRYDESMTKFRENIEKIEEKKDMQPEAYAKKVNQAMAHSEACLKEVSELSMPQRDKNWSQTLDGMGKATQERQQKLLRRLDHVKAHWKVAQDPKNNTSSTLGKGL